MDSKFKKLSQPIKLGKKIAKNRTWMTAHATLLVKDHLFNESHINYYAKRAQGGVAVITMEAMAVHPTTQPYEGKAFSFDKRIVSEYRKISNAVHKYDTLILSQPWHRGRQTNSITNGLPVWAPSPIPCSVYREMPHEMTEEDIDEIIEGYRLSAIFSKEGGLDGIEIHGASHGYLLNQFLSPATNHRKDRYGGNFENRFRLLKKIIEVTRASVGKDMIVGLRINSDDGHNSGLRPNDWAHIAKTVEKTGYVDYLSVSHGTYLNRMLIYPTSPIKHGYQLNATELITKEVSIPTVGVGRITHPEDAEKWLNEGKCDFVGLARALIADPMWVNKALTNESKKIRPCVGANWCMTKIYSQSHLGCIHNPFVGKEGIYNEENLEKISFPKNIAVVGGGPGGMRAAWTLSRRGHKVTLFEKNNKLGGQVNLWTTVNSRKEQIGIINWLKDRIDEEMINICLKTEAYEENLKNFDKIVFATGSYGIKHGWSMLHPEKWGSSKLPGSNLPHVISYSELFETGKINFDNVVLVDTMGSRQGAVCAEYLIQKGAKTVHFITQLSHPYSSLSSSRDWGKVHKMLKEKNIIYYVDNELIKIGLNYVTLKDIYNNKITNIDNIQTVVLILGSISNNHLYNIMKKNIESYIIGDAVAGRRVNDAIMEGEIIARNI
ncbi:MAG: NADH:flavin oxidoreductase [Rhodospirillaceae bacterium]|nr:NADH:flavin oxidoreductase [Rhodospirillaceae bacterium]|tara:strand:+ start:66 stop:2054 length:1989 start_codon:yes stop_codon:yes gene_type:complete